MIFNPWKFYRSARDAAFVFFLLMVPAQAGNWDIEATITETGAYQSNPLMRINGGEAIYGSITTPEVTLVNKTPTASLSFKNSVTQNLFNDADFNSTDLHNVTQIKKNSEHWAVGLGLNGDYDTTRTSELTTFGLDTKNIRHWAYGAAPQISYAPNKENILTLSAGASASRYESNRYTDYDIYSSGLSWAHVFTPFSTGSLQLNARRYETRNNIDETVDSLGPSVAWEMKASEKLTMLLSVGAEASRQDREGLDNSSWQWNTVFSGGLTYKGEQDTLTLKASRAQQPYGNGSSSLLTTVSFSENHRFNKLFSGGLGGSYQRAKQSTLSNSNLKSKITGDASATYHMSEEWNLRASYQHRRETLTNTDSVQTDNAVKLSLIFHPEF